jgi:hypothetical protein
MMTTTRAAYLFTVDYHGGQSSRGYRLACRLQRRLRAHGALVPEWPHGEGHAGGNALTAPEQATYDALAARYGEHV